MRNVTKKSKKINPNLAKKISLIIVCSAMVIVVLALIILPFVKEENLAKSKIDQLARDYYENFFYDDYTNSEKFQQLENKEEAMQKYVDRGFSRLTLRQLLLHDSDKNAETAVFLRKVCDENKTYVQIFPEPPFTKTSYHLKVTYSCNF